LCFAELFWRALEEEQPQRCGHISRVKDVLLHMISAGVDHFDWSTMCRRVSTDADVEVDLNITLHNTYGLPDQLATVNLYTLFAYCECQCARSVCLW
jgi:hypothetical protein